MLYNNYLKSIISSVNNRGDNGNLVLRMLVDLKTEAIDLERDVLLFHASKTSLFHLVCTNILIIRILLVYQRL